MSAAPPGAIERFAAAVALVSGLVVLVAIVAADTFDRAGAGEQATDLVRDELSTTGLCQQWMSQ